MDKYVFVDESGNENLDFTQPGVSRHYIVVAVLVDADQHTAAMDIFERTRREHFQTGEMKSSAIGENHGRRNRVLDALAAAPFGLYILDVDKSKLTTLGFQFWRSFIKHLHGRLYKDICKDFSAVRIQADRIKKPWFVRELQGYVERINTTPLFNTTSWEYMDSKANVGIQAADMIAGTLALCERNDWSPPCPGYLRVLRDRIRHLDRFPQPLRPYTVEYEADHGNRFDLAITLRARTEAGEFINRYRDSDDLDKQLGMRCVQALINHGDTHGLNAWMSTEALRLLLEEASAEEISEHKVRNVVGQCRDAGVLIASRTAGGYKLPTCIKDLIEFLNRQNSQIGPMLQRVRMARETMRRATEGQLDILSPEPYANLRRAIEAALEWPDGQGNP